jgi:hypothetical protein
VRNGVASEHRAIGRPQGLVPDRLVGHPGPRAEDADPVVHETPEGSGFESAHQRNLPPLASFHKGADLVGHLLLGLVPGEGLARGKGPAIAIGMVQALERRLAGDAERPTRPRKARIALELDDAAVAVLREHAASGGAFATGGRKVRRDAGNNLFRRRHHREQLTCRTATTAGRRDGARGGDDLEERPAVYLAPWPAHRLISFERSSSEG